MEDKAESVLWKMPEEKRSSKSTWGIVVLGALASTGLSLVIACVPFVMPAMRKICLPYVPATDCQVKNVLSILKKRKGNVIDLGSGDGRIVLAAAQQGFVAYGVELNPWLVLYSKIKAYQLGLNKKAFFKREDIWKTNLKQFENVVIFGVDVMMPKLEEKVSKELEAKACVIACRYPLPNWTETLSVGHGIDTVWLYEKKHQKKVY